MSQSVCLIGGPPWGLRIATARGGRVFVTQVLPDGRADKEGVRVGDVVDAVNGERSVDPRLLHSKMRSAHGILQLKLTRLPSPSNNAPLNHTVSVQGKPPLPVPLVRPQTTKVIMEQKVAPEVELKIETHEKPTPSPRHFGILDSVSEVDADSDAVRSNPFPLRSAEFLKVDGYNGGTRGSALDKKRYFEMIANKQFRQQAHTDHLLQQKIQMGGSLGLPSDLSTVVSGYDSVGGDFAALNQSATATEGSRHSPTSCDLTEDEWLHEKKPTVSEPAIPGIPAMHTATTGDSALPLRYASPPPARLHSASTLENGRGGCLLPSEAIVSTDQESVTQKAAQALDGLVAQVSRLHLKTLHGDRENIPKKSGMAMPPPAPTNPLNRWTVKLEDNDEAHAEGSVEVPQRQSVASLREQIANKLEVKSPTGAKSLPTASDAKLGQPRSGITPGTPVPAERGESSSVVVDASVRPPSRSATEPVAPRLFEGSIHSSQLVVHEPAKRHHPCITPVPFSKPTLLTHSASLQPAPLFDSNSPKSESHISNAFNDPCNSSAPHVVNGCEPDEAEKYSAEPFSTTAKIVSKLDGSDSAIDLTPPAKPPPLTEPISEKSAKCVNGYTSEQNVASPSSVSAESAKPEMPAFSVPYEPQSLSAQAEQSPAFHSAIAQRLALAGSACDDSLGQGSLKENGAATSASHASMDGHDWYKNMFKKMHRIDERDQTVSKYYLREFSTPSPYHSSRAWTPTSRTESRADSRIDYEPRRSKSVGRYADSSMSHDEDIVERWREERTRLSQQGPSSATARSLSGRHSALGASNFASGNYSGLQDRTMENGMSAHDARELKKLSNEEMINRQKVEKLSEELEEQRNRRHGYVPSASPALQKNFERLNGLLNDFGRTERSSTPKRFVSPAAATTCTALYSFRAQNARELSFNRGDVIRVHRTVDSNWLEGERNGQMGIFPSSYVQIDECLPSEQKRVTAMFPFFARNRNELTLKKGEVVRHRRMIDANWMEGVNSRGEIGIFPVSYVQETRNLELSAVDVDFDTRVPARPKTPKLSSLGYAREESPMPSKKMSHGDEVQAWQKRHTEEGFSGPAHIVPKNAQTYRALYAYKPENADELELRENDIVFVVEKCDDGWYIGTLLRTGQFGTFPGNYVERH